MAFSCKNPSLPQYKDKVLLHFISAAEALCFYSPITTSLHFLSSVSIDTSIITKVKPYLPHGSGNRHHSFPFSIKKHLPENWFSSKPGGVDLSSVIDKS